MPDLLLLRSMREGGEVVPASEWLGIDDGASQVSINNDGSQVSINNDASSQPSLTSNLPIEKLNGLSFEAMLVSIDDGRWAMLCDDR